MYQVVEKEQYYTKPTNEEKGYPQKEYEKPVSQRSAASGKGEQGKWKVVDDDFGTTGSFGRKDFKAGTDGADMKTTVKRSNYI